MTIVVLCYILVVERMDRSMEEKDQDIAVRIDADAYVIAKETAFKEDRSIKKVVARSIYKYAGKLKEK